ncbi:hypothetical protein C8R44DRAFT_978125 [Mycena epipterygia]|nr:hypothetical protein C8R44DRAFT_978125 [Mycena epipterygia]
MTRVVRTLGENVATKLVFPVPSTTTPGASARLACRRPCAHGRGVVESAGNARSSVARRPRRARTSSAARAQLDVAAEDSDSSASAYSTLSGGKCALKTLLCSHSLRRILRLRPATFDIFLHIQPFVGSAATRPAGGVRICALMAHAAVLYPVFVLPAFLVFTLWNTFLFIYAAAGVLIPIDEIRIHPAPTSSSSVRYDRGTPVRVSYAVFSSLAASALVPLSSSSDPRAGPPVGYSTDEPYNGTPSSRSEPPASSSYAPSSPHVKFDPKTVGHDRSPPPSSMSSSTAEETRVGYDRGTHRTEKGWSGEWVTGVDGSGKGVQSMDDVANRLRGLRLR